MNACPCSAQITDDRYMCQGCAATAKADLQAAAPFLGWLDDKRARRGALRLDGGSPAAETPLPYDPRVNKIAGPVIKALTTWARLHSEEHFDHPKPLTTPEATALWLAEFTEWAATKPWSVEAFNEYGAALDEMHRLFDVPPNREAIGECGADLEDRICREFLTAEEGADWHDCPHCGTRHNVRERRAELIRQSEDINVSIPEAVRLLRVNGHNVDQRTVRAIVKVVKIEGRDSRALDSVGRLQRITRYRLGDITNALNSLDTDSDTRRAVKRARRGSVATVRDTLSACG